MKQTSGDPGSAGIAPSDQSRTFGVAVPIGVVVAVAIVGAAGLFVWDTWFVNHDGTFYMALAHNLRHAAAYTFPDGSVATFRGPGYPGLLGAGWLLLEESARAAIWVSRGAGLLIPTVSALLLWRWTRSWWVALSVGTVAAVQPWALISGAQFFAPDGFGFGLALVAVLVAFWSPGELPDDRRLRIAGVALGLAFVVKDPLVLVAMVPVGVIAVHREGGLRSAVNGAAILAQGWLVVAGPWLLYSLIAGGELPPSLGSLSGFSAWMALAATVGLPFMAPRIVGRGGPTLPVWAGALGVFLAALLVYVVVTAVDVGQVTEVWDALRADLQTQLYRDSVWGLLLPALALAVTWAVTRRRQVPVQVAMFLAVVGLAGLVFASLSGSGLRNAVILPYAVLLLVGLAVEGLASWHRWTIAPSVVLLAAVFLGSVQASSATNDRLPIASLTAESPATVAAAGWLQEEAAGSAVAGTSLFLQSLWRLGGGADPWYLLPNHVMDAALWEGGERAFTRRSAWAGIESAPATTETGVSYTVNRSRIGSYLPDTIVDSLSGADYLVVTGNAGFPASAFDGGGLLPLLEAAAGLTPVWRSPVESDQWVVIYRVDGPLTSPGAPTIIHLATPGPVADLAADQVVVGSADYQVMVREILSRPVQP